MREINFSDDQHDMVGPYLGGRLSEPEADAFEEHCFACERCSSEVLLAGEFREAMGQPCIAWQTPSRNSKVSALENAWLLLAAAAAVGMVALGLRQLGGGAVKPPFDPVYRGAIVEALPLDVNLSAAGQVQLSWAAVGGAQVYVVQIRTTDGTIAWKRRTTETAILLDLATLPPLPAGVSFEARIEALDTMRELVAKSESKRLPNP